jgi:hypothetical protein
MDEQLTDDDEAEFSSVDHAIDTETQDGCNFFKAKAFRGPMRGFVFRTCVGGTGYYRDQPPCLTISLMTHLFPRELIVPTGISISDCLTAAELRQNGRQEERRGAAYPRTAPKLTRRGGRGRRGRLDCIMMNDDADVAMVRQPSEPIHESVSYLDDWHVKAGLWAFDTANPNAWHKGKDYLAGTTADIILLQETKVEGGDKLDSAEAAAKSLKWRASIAPCCVTSAGGMSAGVAVAVRQHIGLAEADTRAGTLLEVHAGRFMSRLVGQVCKGGGALRLSLRLLFHWNNGEEEP